MLAWDTLKEAAAFAFELLSSLKSATVAICYEERTVYRFILPSSKS